MSYVFVVILPRLAEYNAELFEHQYLHTVVSHLLTRKDADRATAFISLGQISIVRRYAYIYAYMFVVVFSTFCCVRLSVPPSCHIWITFYRVCAAA